MGGNALKHLGVERIDFDSYRELSLKILDRLSPMCQRIAIIPAYRKKETFGDMDILVIPESRIDLRKAINQIFSPRELIHNGNCYSFDVDNFQIDVITDKLSTFDFALNYYSYNDLGNLMGRIAHKFGLKYGHQGLELILRREATQHVIAELLVSLDSYKVMSFLGYNPERFKEGFDTLDDIFKFASSTPFFNSDIFNYENLNHINRVRNKKRDSYKLFLEWLRKQEGLTNFYFDIKKSKYLPIIFENFPHLKEDYRIAIVNENKRVLLQSKFNGLLVQELHPHLKGPSLGEFIKSFREAWGTSDDFNDWLVQASTEEIRKAILSFHLIK